MSCSRNCSIRCVDTIIIDEDDEPTFSFILLLLSPARSKYAEILSICEHIHTHTVMGRDKMRERVRVGLGEVNGIGQYKHLRSAN